ncbi:MAG TPA: sigma-70 family RNA polymerase sigma factor [Candidatus Polarisedimenticolia bacterium]|jgi:RNA polymerase sigma-70 factor (ECF subfamily)|nr:sigma-70 family RNA polymerase sigma factor [Dongiaceae bacterium]HYV89619.1 sigma-70 family RNA polymerase sigma factor [Candidatus Polarisedimenticolia bacterium]
MDQGFSHQLVALLPRLRRFARGLARSPEDGDDLVQAACERALARRDQFQPGTRLDSWMYRIVQNLWIDNRRRHSREMAAIDAGELAEQSAAIAPGAADEALYLAQVREAIGQLPHDQRAVLMLISVEGVAYKDAAEILELPLGTVMSRLSRARLALGRLLEERALEEKAGRREGEAGATIVRIKR